MRVWKEKRLGGENHHAVLDILCFEYSVRNLHGTSSDDSKTRIQEEVLARHIIWSFVQKVVKRRGYVMPKKVVKMKQRRLNRTKENSKICRNRRERNLLTSSLFFGGNLQT
jgi:hypothetical protein